jgi:hypothetical protein
LHEPVDGIPGVIDMECPICRQIRQGIRSKMWQLLTFEKAVRMIALKYQGVETKTLKNQKVDLDYRWVVEL